jgi:hypothetical protein
MKEKNPMENLGVAYRAISAACVYNLDLDKEGYGCDSIDMFNGLVEEFAAIAIQFPEMDTDGIIEFYELHV